MLSGLGIHWWWAHPWSPGSPLPDYDLRAPLCSQQPCCAPGSCHHCSTTERLKDFLSLVSPSLHKSERLHNKKHYRDLLPSTTDQVRVCQGKVTHIPLVTWVDLRWVTVEFSRILAQFVRLNVSGLRQEEKLSIQLQPRQESGGKRQKTQVQIRRWEFKLKYTVKPASLMRDETCSALSSWNFLNHQQKNKMTCLWNLI